MPVIGHALAGIVVAQQVEPARFRNGQPAGAVTRALWTPALVGLSYLPDIATQVGFWLGYRAAQEAGHSMPAGLVAGLVIGALWARATGARWRALTGLAAGLILLHDVFDMLQDAQRMPFWPFSNRMLGVDWLNLPNRLWGELLLFGLPFALYEGWRWVRRRRLPAPAPPPVPAVWRWLGRGIVVAVLLSTLGVLQLRQVRGRQLDLARDLQREGLFPEALAAADAADRWPATSGTPDIVRGEIYDRLGDAVRAETFFQRALERERDSFWPVAALAQHYASYGTIETRRLRSQPYVDRLKREFADDDGLERVLARIERSVAKGN